MSNDAFYTQACSPRFPQQEEGEWVWVPKNTTPAPGFPAIPHQSPMYRSFSSGSSLASPTYSPIQDFPSSSDGSPVEPLLEGFDTDMMVFQPNPYFGERALSWDFQIPDNTAFTNFITNAQDADWLSGAGLELLEGLGAFQSTASPVSSAYGILDFPDATGPALASLAPLTPASSLTIASTTPESASPTTPAPTQLLSCSEASCNKAFPNRTDLRKHERKHRQPFRCPVAQCDKGHLDKRALSRHLWAKHPDVAQQTNARSERVKCPSCEYEGRQDNVARHMKRHAKVT